jgi:hypothetical protein
VVTRLDSFVTAVLPALFVLGKLTFAALWHNTLENLVLLRKMQDIRGYYRGLVPEASQFFDPPEADVQYQAALATVGLRASPLQMLFTGASLVAAINCILGGTGLALLAARLGPLGGYGGAHGRPGRRADPVRIARARPTAAKYPGRALTSGSGSAAGGIARSIRW